jgi:hypothetical protein
MINLFRVDENRIKQCFAAHVGQCCQQCCSAISIVTPECGLIQSLPTLTAIMNDFKQVST